MASLYNIPSKLFLQGHSRIVEVEDSENVSGETLENDEQLVK